MPQRTVCSRVNTKITSRTKVCNRQLGLVFTCKLRWCEWGKKTFTHVSLKCILVAGNRQIFYPKFIFALLFLCVVLWLILLSVRSFLDYFPHLYLSWFNVAGMLLAINHWRSLQVNEIQKSEFAWYNWNNLLYWSVYIFHK